MAKVVQVTAGYTRTLNLGDYNSVKSSFSATVDLEDGDAVEAVALATRRMVKNNVCADLAPYNDKMKAYTEELFMGLRIEEGK